MGKNRTRSDAGEGKSGSGRSASTGKGSHPWGVLSPQARLFEVVLHMGFEGVVELLEADRERLCGPRRRWQRDRTAYRYGHDDGRLVYGGRTVKVKRPRVRSLDGRELELPTWKHFSEEDPLQDRVVRQILAGVTSRNYAASLEAMPEGMAPGLVSAASVSRRFVAVTRRRMTEFLSRSLTELDIVTVLIDGTGLGDTMLLTALGIARSGRKHVLGVVEGTTESETTCRSLLRDLIERGLQVVPQVGVAGYRIDLGVVDPDLPGRFVCGIECDGVAYHSSETARDRDRLRQQVLEARGWTLLRVWC